MASDGDNFLVAWLRKCSGDEEIQVRHVLANGDKSGEILTLDSASNVSFPKLAWVGDRYQAVWERGSDIYTAYISDGSATEPEAVSASAASEWRPQIAYDPLSARTLVIYTGRSGGSRSLRGRILAGPNTSEELTIGNLTDEAGWEAAVSNDPVNGGWAVVWSLNGQYTVYSQGVGMNGELRGERERAEPGGRNYIMDLTCAEPRVAALFHFDGETRDSALADSSGFGNDADYCWNACPDFEQEGKYGDSVYFPGWFDPGTGANPGSWVEVEGVGVSDTAYGVTFWFKADCSTCGIYSIGRTGAGYAYDDHDRDIYLVNGNLCARLGMGDPSNTASEVICSSGDNFADGQWHHVAHTFGGGVGGQHLYLDGTLRARGDRASSDLNVAHDVLFGLTEDVQEEFFKGYLDELTIYPRALSEGEVIDDYLGALVVYPFDEVSGAETFNNAARSGYDAATCSAGECPQAGKEGVAHSALEFDYYDFITGPDLPLANSSFTVAFWAQRGINRKSYIITQGSGNTRLRIGFWRGWMGYDTQLICAFGDDVLATPEMTR